MGPGGGGGGAAAGGAGSVGVGLTAGQVGAVAVGVEPSIAVADALGADDRFYACADTDGSFYGAWVGAEPNCQALEDEYNEFAGPESYPIVDLRKVEWRGGQPGAQGPAGTNLSGYGQKSESFKIAKGTSSKSVGCAAGQVPVSGGADSNSSSVTVRGSHPTAEGWKVRFYSTSSSTKDVKVFLVCANAPAAAS